MRKEYDFAAGRKNPHASRLKKQITIRLDQEAIAYFKAAANVSTRPFIFLSAGVSNAEFTESLELAGESGVKFSGVLCGRATWKDGIPVYAKQGAAAFRDWLSSEGVKNINNVNARLKAAHPWYEFYGAQTADALA